MKRTLTLTLLTASLIVCMHCGVQAAPGEPTSQRAAEPAQVLASLGWLEGRWAGKTSDGEDFEAIYSSPTGGVILSINKMLANGQLLFTEFERFEVADGEVVMTPFPDGQRACTFALTSHDGAAKRAVFENPKNDFPKRIVYERAADDRLHIEVEGDQGGRAVKLVLDLKRSS